MKDSNVTIAVVAPQEPFEFFELFWEGVWSAAHELAPLGVNVLTASTAGPDADEPARVLRELLDQDVQAIVLLPGQQKGLDAVIEQHALRNRPVITVFNDAPSSRRCSFVGPNFRLSGQIAGNLMAKFIKPKSHIVALTGPGDHPHLEDRYEGFYDALRASKVPLGMTRLNDPMHFAEVISGRGRTFDGLFIGCSETADIVAVLKQIRHPARCITFDLTDAVKPFLESGVISSVIDSSRYYQGYMAVQQAYSRVQTNSQTFTWVPVPSTVVLPEHIGVAGERCALNPALETVIRQRTSQVHHYRQALKSANARLMRVAETDPLTGLLNRRRLEEILETEVAGAEAVGPLSLMLLDIDHFKSQNDLLGYPVGDQTLQLVADQLRSTFRATDFLARFGADEFAVVLPATSPESAVKLRERIEAIIGEARLPMHPDLRLGASAGIATLPGTARTSEELIASATENLYMAKRSRTRASLHRLIRTG